MTVIDLSAYFRTKKALNGGRNLPPFSPPSQDTGALRFAKSFAIVGLSVAFNALSYGFDFPEFVSHSAAVFCGAYVGMMAFAAYQVHREMSLNPNDYFSIYRCKKQLTPIAANGASGLVAFAVIAAGMVGNIMERKICLQPNNLQEKIALNELGSKSKDLIASDTNRILQTYMDASSGGEQLKYSTRTVFLPLATDFEKTRICVTVGRENQELFNSGTFDQVGAAKAITARWSELLRAPALVAQ